MSPPRRTRQKITRHLAKIVHEHLIVFATADHSIHCWQWAKRDRGKTTRYLQHAYSRGQPAEGLAQKLERLRFTLDEEDHVSIADANSRVASAFDVEKVTKRFYDRFKTEHQVFLKFISGVSDVAGREWYASLMLNRMMFIYFIQKRSFLDGDPDYLRNRLETVAKTNGNGKFHSFYRIFLLRLFHEGLGKPEADRDPGLAQLIGEVPYLNGGLFDVHVLESENPNIDIPDDAFMKIFDFFDAYQWHLDDRPLRDDNEINPDVLGFIFEKYVNQKQMGAYYTKEDITGYISRNTILPRLLDQAKEDCAIAFMPKQGVWQLLVDEPDRYIYPSVRHGITLDMSEGSDRESEKQRSLPLHIAAGLNDTAKRDEWNKPAPPEYALPTETWREHIARRQYHDELRRKLAAGEIFSVNDLITCNLDIEQFVEDAINYSEGPELVRAFWKAIRSVSILDPTVGSGAFLFAALSVLEPLYKACLSTMRSLLDDFEISKHKHQREKMNDFRQILAEIDQHPSETYFVLKSIAINNLYGVDIMEEAVEICKLRLFLKLVAQLETYEQIEPLPDIDFNIRTGNTLVGFISMDEIKRILGADLIREQFSLPRIVERAEKADIAFAKFREMQAEPNLNTHQFKEAKATLRQRLSELRTELDNYLAEDYGIQIHSSEDYGEWQRSHQPFHWFIEFYGIIRRGGFDIIIGNPPYIEYARLHQYSIKGYTTAACGNLYAFVVERSFSLVVCSGRTGMIVPHSSICTNRMASFISILERFGEKVWTSSYDIRPSKLFIGVDQRLMIYLTSGGRHPEEQSTVFFSSRYNRWRHTYRPALLKQIRYTRAVKSTASSISKIGHGIEAQILNKIKGHTTIRFSLVERGEIVYYHNAPRYWIRATDFEPYFWNERDGKKSSTHLKSITVQKPDRSTIVAILNSSMFYFWFVIWSNCRDLTYREIETFPIGLQAFRSDTKRKLQDLSAQLMINFKQHSERKELTKVNTGRVVYDEFKQGTSKPIVDEIDYVLAPHYNLTDEELDFIINYDIKFRIGAVK